MAALTALWGFSSFITSHFAGIRSIGYTSILGIGLSGLAAITLLPAILIEISGLPEGQNDEGPRTASRPEG